MNYQCQSCFNIVEEPVCRNNKNICPLCGGAVKLVDKRPTTQLATSHDAYGRIRTGWE